MKEHRENNYKFLCLIVAYHCVIFCPFSIVNEEDLVVTDVTARRQ
jgi:hypothetical protein